MAPSENQGRASFFWQGLFILLPVAIMAGIALMALVRDRAAAEREARQRAEELLQQLGNGFDRAMGFQVSQLGSGAGGWYGQLWTQEHLTEAALWPGSLERHKAEQERQTLAQAHAQAEAALAELARVSGLQPEEFILADLSFTPEGAVNAPNEQVRETHPPAWRLDLSADQLQAWSALEQPDSSATNSERLDPALKAFLDTNPSEEARANAEFLRLRLVLANAPASNAVAQWLEFARQCAGTPLSESGVPLSSLAVAKALQRARETGATEALWNGLVREVHGRPSAFTPMLLDLAEPLVQNLPELQSCLQALRLHWETTQRAWEAADAIRCSGRLQGITTTNFWFEFQGSRWLCLLRPAQSWTGSGAGTVTNWFTQARLFPKPAVEAALRQVVQDSRVSLPAYLRLSAEVEGEQLSGALDTAKLLQVAAGGSSVRSAMSIESAPEEGQAPSGAARSAQPGSGIHVPLLTELRHRRARLAAL